MQVIRQELNTHWRFTDLPRPGASPTTKLPWLPAEVPGHVHLDLLRAGAIPDPFYRLNERAVAWVDETNFVYETTFEVEDPLPSLVYLVFHGIDTVAEIKLNGEVLGRTDNMYIPHEFSVGGKLVVGENRLQVTFAAALRIGRERYDAWEAAGNDMAKPDWYHWGPRSFVRKAQYMYGWDWGPELLGCGLWGKVELVTVPVARITDWQYDVEFTEGEKAVVTLKVDIERSPIDATDSNLILSLKITQVDFMDGITSDDPLPEGVSSELSSQNSSVVRITIDNARRWFPIGYNRTFADSSHPPLYSLKLTLSTMTDKIDEISAKIGLRTLELMREPDADGPGEGFQFRVNGEDIYIKGANWIPAHSFPGTLPSAPDIFSYDIITRQLMMICDAGFNMLRIWGGGLYESEHFYELCDAHGILVWQDFPYACAYHPDTGEYAEAARIEAIAAVRRIRNHPCLALWCGNNENQMMYNEDWHDLQPPRLLGEHLYNEVLPAVVATEDPKTPYWPGSPYGGAFPNDPNSGDCHNWDVWHGRGDWIHYTENDSRFCSEFGFASSCGLGAWDKCLGPTDKSPHSPAVRWHDKTRKGYETYLGYIALHFPEAVTLEDLVYYSQLNQAEALKFGVEHYRRRKGRNWGTLFWQLNDCWPTQSWSIIDSEGEPKAAYFACKKFYAPVLLSLVREGEVVTAHLVNDLLTSLKGNLIFILATFDGETLAETTEMVSVEANAAAAVASFSLTSATDREREVYVYARFTSGEGSVSAENTLILAEPKDLRMSNPGVQLTVSTYNPYTFAIHLTTTRFAPYLWLRRVDNKPLTGLQDNFFHLKPGETRILTFERDETLKTVEDLRGLLTVRTL